MQGLGPPSKDRQPSSVLNGFLLLRLGTFDTSIAIPYTDLSIDFGIFYVAFLIFWLVGCLSLLGGPRPCTRFDEIEVEYQDASFQLKKDKFTGWTAQIIQHELDHVNGVLI